MNIVKYNEHTTIGYKQIPIYASANVVTGTRYFTELYLIQGQSRYPLGQLDGKLDEEEVKARFTELMEERGTRQYGQSSNALLTRRELTPVRDRARGFSNLSRRKLTR